MKRIFKYIVPATAIALFMGTTSCTSDLDVTPISPKLTTEGSVTGLFNKCYSSLAMAGIGDGGSGDGGVDVTGYDDPGMTGLIRQMWNSNELTTDEAICSWGDDGIPQFNFNSYDDAEPMCKAYFSRIALSISYCNHYLETYGDYDATMTAEVRFVRALHYYLMMDAFGNIPFSETVSKPIQLTRTEAFNWLEKELLEIEPLLADAKAKVSTDEGYGRADKAAVWMLLMRLYLNAAVYTGEAKWTEAAQYAQKVIGSSYKLNEVSSNGWSPYQMLFMGDNGETDAAYECVFPIIQDSKLTASYGNSTFLTQSCFNADMFANPNDPDMTNGLTSAWSGNRARPDLVKLFNTNNYTEEEMQVPSYAMTELLGDDRALFWGQDRTLDIESYDQYKQGFAVAKFVAFHTDGTTSYNNSFSDADWFLFRVAEAYLTIAECDARQHNGTTTTTGDNAINKLRQRANNYNQKSGYTLSEICDEWGREFYFEGRRRTDLIRFNRFGGSNNYSWTWKGGVKKNGSFEAYKNIFAIPANELVSNGNLKQNPGYIK